MWMKDGCKVGCVKPVVRREGGLVGALQPHGVLFTGEKVSLVTCLFHFGASAPESMCIVLQSVNTNRDVIMDLE